jgi:cytidylate kinase
MTACVEHTMNARRASRIAIDGPAGSGKSTIGEQLARRLGYLYVDTGAMYRAVAWLALRKGVELTDGLALAPLARHVRIGPPHVDDGRKCTVTIQGYDATWDIHGPAVTQAVSPVCLQPPVRAVLLALQRSLARRGSVVMVGRDVGTVVLPNADLKIYLTASPQIRAYRRRNELLRRASEDDMPVPSVAEVLDAIIRRDRNDEANMRPADDAVVIVNEGVIMAQLLDTLERATRGHSATTLGHSASEHA